MASDIPPGGQLPDGQNPDERETQNRRSPLPIDGRRVFALGNGAQPEQSPDPAAQAGPRAIGGAAPEQAAIPGSNQRARAIGGGTAPAIEGSRSSDTGRRPRAIGGATPPAIEGASNLPAPRVVEPEFSNRPDPRDNPLAATLSQLHMALLEGRPPEEIADLIDATIGASGSLTAQPLPVIVGQDRGNRPGETFPSVEGEDGLIIIPARDQVRMARAPEDPIHPAMEALRAYTIQYDASPEDRRANGHAANQQVLRSVMDVALGGQEYDALGIAAVQLDHALGELSMTTPGDDFEAQTAVRSAVENYFRLERNYSANLLENLRPEQSRDAAQDVLDQRNALVNSTYRNLTGRNETGIPEIPHGNIEQLRQDLRQYSADLTGTLIGQQREFAATPAGQALRQDEQAFLDWELADAAQAATLSEEGYDRFADIVDGAASWGPAPGMNYPEGFDPYQASAASDNLRGLRDAVSRGEADPSLFMEAIRDSANTARDHLAAEADAIPGPSRTAGRGGAGDDGAAAAFDSPGLAPLAPSGDWDAPSSVPPSAGGPGGPGGGASNPVSGAPTSGGPGGPGRGRGGRSQKKWRMIVAAIVATVVTALTFVGLLSNDKKHEAHVPRDKAPVAAPLNDGRETGRADIGQEQEVTAGQKFIEAHGVDGKSGTPDDVYKAIVKENPEIDSSATRKAAIKDGITAMQRGDYQRAFTQFNTYAYAENKPVPHTVAGLVQFTGMQAAYDLNDKIVEAQTQLKTTTDPAAIDKLKDQIEKNRELRTFDVETASWAAEMSFGNQTLTGMADQLNDLGEKADWNRVDAVNLGVSIDKVVADRAQQVTALHLGSTGVGPITIGGAAVAR